MPLLRSGAAALAVVALVLPAAPAHADSNVIQITGQATFWPPIALDTCEPTSITFSGNVWAEGSQTGLYDANWTGRSDGCFLQDNGTLNGYRFTRTGSWATLSGTMDVNGSPQQFAAHCLWQSQGVGLHGFWRVACVGTAATT